MRRIRLDRIDRRILRNLLTNGRMTNVELARRVGISAPPCLRRVRALEEAGMIRGYHADLAPEPLGYAVTVFAQVGPNREAFQPGTEPHAYAASIGIGPGPAVSPLNPAGAPMPAPLPAHPAEAPKAIKPKSDELNGLF